MTHKNRPPRVKLLVRENYSSFFFRSSTAGLLTFNTQKYTLFLDTLNMLSVPARTLSDFKVAAAASTLWNWDQIYKRNL